MNTGDSGDSIHWTEMVPIKSIVLELLKNFADESTGPLVHLHPN